MLTLVCKECRNQFKRYPSQVKLPGYGSFCSLRCKGKANAYRVVAVRKAAADAARRSATPPDVPAGSAPIVLNRGKVALVSVEDQELASRTWSYTNHGYALEINTKTFLHRSVMERKIGRLLLATEYVDHKNRNKLDNRRENLRFADHTQNAANTGLSPANRSGYKGVSWSENRTKFCAYIRCKGIGINLGRFETAEEAAWMYDQWALGLHGEFAVLNFHYIEVGALKL